MDKESSPATSSSSSAALTLTRRQVAVVLLSFVASLLAVGLLAGLVRPTRPSLAVRKPATAASSVRSSIGADQPWLNARLPSHILPLHYDLTIFPDFYQPDQNGGRFYGNVSILVNVTSRAIKHLLVHAKGLTIHRTTVRLHQPASPDDDEREV